MGGPSQKVGALEKGGLFLMGKEGQIVVGLLNTVQFKSGEMDSFKTVSVITNKLKNRNHVTQWSKKSKGGKRRTSATAYQIGTSLGNKGVTTEKKKNTEIHIEGMVLKTSLIKCESVEDSS